MNNSDSHPKLRGRIEPIGPARDSAGVGRKYAYPVMGAILWHCKREVCLTRRPPEAERAADRMPVLSNDQRRIRREVE